GTSDVVTQSGGILSGTAATSSYELSGTGNLTGTVNTQTATISGSGTVGSMGVLNATTSVTQTGGTMGGMVTTNIFAQSGGTMQGSVKTNSYLLSGGTLANTNKVSTNAFGQTGGTVQGTVVADIKAQAIGGTISALSTSGINVSNTGGGIDILTSTNAFVNNGSGTAITARETTGNINIQTNGNVSGAVGIDAAASGSGNVTVSSNGVVTSAAGAAISAGSTSGRVTIAAANAVNGVSQGISATTQNGAIDIQTADVVSGGTGISAVATGAGDVNVAARGNVQGTSGAAISAGSTGGRVTIANTAALTGTSHGIFVKSQLGDISVATANAVTGNTGIALETTGNGAMQLNLDGIIRASDTAISLKGETTAAQAVINQAITAGQTALRTDTKGAVTFDNFSSIRSASSNPENLTLLDNISGQATLNNHAGALLEGVLSSGPGAQTLVNNMAGGVWNIGNSGQFALSGSNDVIQNSGLINATGNTRFNGLEQFRNQAGGNLNLANNQVGDRVSISGSYIGQPGSNISLDVDFNKGTSDVVTLGGVLMGTTNLKLNALSSGQEPTAFGKTILLVDAADSSGNGQVTATGLPTGGIVQYNLVRQTVSEGGTNHAQYVVQSGINGTAASGVVSGFIASQNVIASSFFKPSSGLISAPIDPEKNQFGLAPWIRTNGGMSKIDTQGTIHQPDGSEVNTPATIETSYYGYQVGMDAGVFNIQGTGGNVNFGLTGGQIFGKSNQKNYANTTDFSSVFYGGYAAYTKGPLFFDMQVRQELMDYTITVDDPIFKINGAGVKGKRTSVGGSASYTLAYNDWSFIPATGFTYSNSSTDDLIIPRNILLNQNEGRVQFDDVKSMIGFGGITVSRNFFFSDDRIRLSPFLTMTAYHDFAGDINAKLTLDPNSANPVVLPVKTERLDTYGEASLGMNLLALTGKINGVERLVIGSVRGDVQFGETITGGSVTAQFRMQF
ncbi:beta strand repeat-containing protein, partial [Phyllobacterium sp. 22229]